MTPKSLRGDEPHDPRKRQKHTHAYEGQTDFGGTRSSPLQTALYAQLSTRG
jgi:hypothetical protein